MEKLKALLGKNLSMDELIKFMAKIAIEKVEKEKFKQTQNPKSHPISEVKSAARTPSAAVKREVYLKDRNCTNCGSIHRLNYDHIKPVALGGKSDLTNIRLLCFQCNQRARIKMKL